MHFYTISAHIYSLAICVWRRSLLRKKCEILVFPYFGSFGFSKKITKNGPKTPKTAPKSPERPKNRLKITREV